MLSGMSTSAKLKSNSRGRESPARKVNAGGAAWDCSTGVGIAVAGGGGCGEVALVGEAILDVLCVDESLGAL